MSAVSTYVATAIRASRKTQRQIAMEAGFPSANVLSMIKGKVTKLPIARIPALADALGVSRQELLYLCLREYEPELMGVLEEVLPGALLSRDERRFIEALRVITRP